jgi:hypothetical protein
MYGLVEFASSGRAESAEHGRLRLWREGMNEKYGVGGSVSGSGTDIEWAQIGVSTKGEGLRPPIRRSQRVTGRRRRTRPDRSRAGRRR